MLRKKKIRLLTFLYMIPRPRYYNGNNVTHRNIRQPENVRVLGKRATTSMISSQFDSIPIVQRF